MEKATKHVDNGVDFIKEHVVLQLRKIRENFMAEMAFDLDLEF